MVPSSVLRKLAYEARHTKFGTYLTHQLNQPDKWFKAYSHVKNRQLAEGVDVTYFKAWDSTDAFARFQRSLKDKSIWFVIRRATSVEVYLACHQVPMISFTVDDL